MSGQKYQACEHLKANRQSQDEEGEEIGESNLRQDIDQLKLELATGDIYQDLAEHNEHEGAPNYVAKDLTLVTAPEADHWVQQDAADLVTRTMVSWLHR